MSIRDEITRIERGKADIISAIRERDVQVPDGLLIGEIPPYILEIQGGGGDEGTIVGAASGVVSNHPRGIAFETGTTKPVGFYILTAEQIGVTSGILGATYGLYTDGKTDILSKSSTYGGTCYADAATLSLDRDGTLITLDPNAPGALGGSGTVFRMVYGCGGAVECVTATTVPASGQTSISFNLSKKPDAFCIQLMDQVEFSQYHRVLRVVCDGTNIYGIEFANSLTFSDTAWSWSYNNGVLTVRSQSTNVGGYFHNPGTYKLTAFFGSAGAQSVEVTPLAVTENGTYTAPEGTAYSPISVAVPVPTMQQLVVSGNGTYDAPSNTAYNRVEVNVPVAAAKNVQAYHGMGRSNSSSLASVNVRLTVAKTGTYKVSWMGVRSSTGGTNSSQLYIGGTAYGTASTTFDTTIAYAQSVVLNNVSLTAGQTVEVRARARGTSYYMSVGNLVIEEQ